MCEHEGVVCVCVNIEGVVCVCVCESIEGVVCVSMGSI